MHPLEIKIYIYICNVVPDFTFELLENNPGTGRVATLSN